PRRTRAWPASVAGAWDAPARSLAAGPRRPLRAAGRRPSLPLRPWVPPACSPQLSHVAFDGEPSCGGGVEEGLVVAFVLVGVGGREPGDGLVEDIGAAEVAGDGDPVARAGVRPRQCPPA